MIKFRQIIESLDLKWIVGYIDNYGAVHHKAVKIGDSVDSHNQIWPGPRQQKWRWVPSDPHHINTYGNDLDVDDEDKIWRIIDRYRV